MTLTSADPVTAGILTSADPVTAGIEAVPITAVLGAEVTGVDLQQDCSGTRVDVLAALLRRHAVLVLRDQHALTREGLVAFGRCFGTLESPAAGLASHPEITRIVHDADHPPTENIWHTDLSFQQEPPLGAVVHAVELPPVGGDTVFADMRRAHLGLPDAVRSLVAGLWAEHDIAKWVDAATASRLHEVAPVVRHPVVRAHPETAEPVLFVNHAYTTRIVDMAPDDSAGLLDLLFRQVAVPEVQCRVRWSPGTVVLWDNRSVQHYATGDYHPARRVMERVTIAAPAASGDPPGH